MATARERLRDAYVAKAEAELGALADAGVRCVGNAASPVQFFISDSIRHFIRGALYFNALPNPDSIAPVSTYVEQDIIRLIESLEWK